MLAAIQYSILQEVTSMAEKVAGKIDFPAWAKQ
jgi:hypothetical protein